MAERLIVGLAGSSGTGKTTVAKHLAQRGLTAFEGSTLIRDAAAQQARTLTTRDTYDAFFRAQQALLGRAWLSNLMLRTDGDRLLQVGLRSRHDFYNIKKHGGIVIALVCPPEICLQRIDPSNPKNPRTPEEYIAHQQIEESPDEYGSHTLWVAEHADHKLDTSLAEDVTLGQVDEILELATQC